MEAMTGMDGGRPEALTASGSTWGRTKAPNIPAGVSNSDVFLFPDLSNTKTYSSSFLVLVEDVFVSTSVFAPRTTNDYSYAGLILTPSHRYTSRPTPHQLTTITAIDHSTQTLDAIRR